MNQHKQSSDLHIGRGWLNRAAEMLDSCEDHQSDAEFARAAAMIGNGFIALAHAERALVSMAETSQVRQAILTLSDEPEMTLGEALRHPLGHPVPNAEQPRGEAAYLLEGDDEIFTAEPKDPVVDGSVRLADRLIAIANAVYGNDTRHVLDASTGHGLAAVVRELADGPLIQTEWAAAQFTKLAFELETAGEAADRG